MKAVRIVVVLLVLCIVLVLLYALVVPQKATRSVKSTPGVMSVLRR